MSTYCVQVVMAVDMLWPWPFPRYGTSQYVTEVQQTVLRFLYVGWNTEGGTRNTELTAAKARPRPQNLCAGYLRCCALAANFGIHFDIRGFSQTLFRCRMNFNLVVLILPTIYLGAIRLKSWANIEALKRARFARALISLRLDFHSVASA
jgi:hypothetical protein